MTWADLYLICFIVGFTLSLISAFGGFVHLPHGGHGHVHIGHTHGHGHAGEISWFNFSTITAFLAWFGGIGYLLTRFSGVWLWLAFLLAIVAGLMGASLVFLFLVKVLLVHDKPLDAQDYEMIGVLGQLSSGIRDAGGIGEMSFSQAGMRRSAAAKSEDGNAIERGADVIVTRYDKGIAYVRRWDDLDNSKETL
jgi:membrane protein implicated in regulation of membrane protease activity